MRWILAIAVAVVLVLAFGGSGVMGPVRPAYAACPAGTQLDHTTIGMTRKTIAAAGYSKITDLKKGCDNVWHAKAEKDGTAMRVAVTPDGKVLREGD